MRVHDLRGTFVTVSLANGRSESWLADRTGHRSSAMINRYKRTARSFQELNVGTLLPLDEALGWGGPADGPAIHEEAEKYGVPKGIRRRRAEHDPAGIMLDPRS